MDDSGDGELMGEAAKFLYGDSWQEDFARVLSKWPPERPPEGVSARLVSEWAASRKRPPLWVMSALADLVVANIDEENDRSSHLKSFLTRLNTATLKAAEEGWDGRDGLRLSIVSPEPSLKDEMIASQSAEPVSIGDGVTATWEIPLGKAFPSQEVIDITLMLARDVAVGLVAHSIVEWLMSFRGRASKITINRKQHEFAHGELTKAIEETITIEEQGESHSDNAPSERIEKPNNNPDLSNEWDKDKLRNWMSNAKRLGRHDVYQVALRQLCRVEGRNINDPLESEFAIVMRALEEALTEESGRTKRLSRTRQKLARVGVRKTLADLALKPQPSLGFKKLLEFNMADMSAEALILKYRGEFDDVVVAAARRRLQEYGIETKQYESHSDKARKTTPAQ